jgi:hypothetical protein
MPAPSVAKKQVPPLDEKRTLCIKRHSLSVSCGPPGRSHHPAWQAAHLYVYLALASLGLLLLYLALVGPERFAVPWSQRMAQFLRFEAGRVIEVQDYLDVDRALKAAGLSD